MIHGIIKVKCAAQVVIGLRALLGFKCNVRCSPGNARFNKIEQDCHPRNTSDGSRQGSYLLFLEEDEFIWLHI